MNKEKKTRGQTITRVKKGDMPAAEEAKAEKQVKDRGANPAAETAPPKAVKKKRYTSEAYGHIKIFTPDFIQNIVKRIQAAEAVGPAPGETLWSRKMAAKSFAQELFDTAAKKKQVEKCHTDINGAAELSKDKKAVAFLEDFDIHFLDKVNLLEDKLGGTGSLVMNVIYQLITEGTLTMLDDIAEEYERLYNSARGTVQAKVITAVSLDEEEKAKISQRLGSLTGKKVVVETEIDTGIIGGIVIKIGDKLIDGSLRAKLGAMHRKITEL